MELFSEIYSCYYCVTSEILKKCPLNKKQIELLIRSKAFSESAVFLMPKLCGSNGWGLLKKGTNDYYYSILENTPHMPLTLLQKRWIKSLIEDKRAGLFFDDNTLISIKQTLENIEPLYNSNFFNDFDVFKNGDDYENAVYRQNFKNILYAIQNKTALKINYRSRNDRVTKFTIIPLKIEYSRKNDKFRVYVVQISQPKNLLLINMSKVVSSELNDQIDISKIDINMEKLFNLNKCKQPLMIEISDERNAQERFMMEFAGYEKRSEFDKATKKCIVTLFYNKRDETEVLIRLLSFGPVLEVKEPQYFRNLMKQRINKQYELLFKNIKFDT